MGRIFEIAVLDRHFLKSWLRPCTTVCLPMLRDRLSMSLVLAAALGQYPWFECHHYSCSCHSWGYMITRHTAEDVKHPHFLIAKTISVYVRGEPVGLVLQKNTETQSVPRCIERDRGCENPHFLIAKTISVYVRGELVGPVLTRGTKSV